MSPKEHAKWAHWVWSHLTSPLSSSSELSSLTSYHLKKSQNSLPRIEDHKGSCLLHFCSYQFLFLSLSHTQTHVLCLSLHPSFCSSQAEAHLQSSAPLPWLCTFRVHHLAYSFPFSPLDRLLIFQILPRSSLPLGRFSLYTLKPSQSIRQGSLVAGTRITMVI